MIFFAIFFVGILTTVTSKLTVPNVISNGMVVQANEPVTFWGKSTCDQVEISCSCGALGITSKALSVNVSNVMEWKLDMPQQSAGFDEWTFVIKDCDSEITISKVKFGQVLLCSGQSNMAWPVRKSNKAPVPYGTQDISMFQVEPLTEADSPAFNVGGSWTHKYDDFSAVCYYTAVELYDGTKPIGLVGAYKGGTMIQQWMDDADDIYQCDRDAGISGGRRRRRRKPKKDTKMPTRLFNGMIAPLKHIKFHDLLWYQGEANADQSKTYACLFNRMIESWKHHFGMFFTVHSVELAGYMKKGKPNLPNMRIAQRKWQSVAEHGYLSITALDLGHPKDIHPTNKYGVSKRLAQSVTSGFITRPRVVEAKDDYIEFDEPVSLKDTDGCRKCCKKGSPITYTWKGKTFRPKVLWFDKQRNRAHFHKMHVDYDQKSLKVHFENFSECVFISDHNAMPAWEYQADPK